MLEAEFFNGPITNRVGKPCPVQFAGHVVDHSDEIRSVRGSKIHHKWVLLKMQLFSSFASGKNKSILIRLAVRCGGKWPVHGPAAAPARQ